MLPQSISTIAKRYNVDVSAGILPLPLGQFNKGTLYFLEACDCNSRCDQVAAMNLMSPLCSR